MQPSLRPSADKRGRVWGHVLVSLSACALTVSIVGSAVVLAYKSYRRYELKTKVRSFVSALENRTPAELQERAAELKARPKVAAHVLPELQRALANARSERQLVAVIELAGAFVSEPAIESALFELRRDGRETVAGAAVRVLGEIEPPKRAAELLGKCLDGYPSGELVEAAVDEACAGLFRLGAPGLEVMRKRLGLLPPERRAWLVGYVAMAGGPDRRRWLELLGADSDPVVRDALRDAARSSGESDAVANSTTAAAFVPSTD